MFLQQSWGQPRTGLLPAGAAVHTLLPLFRACSGCQGKGDGSSLHGLQGPESLIGVGLYLFNELFSLSHFKYIFHRRSLFFNVLFLAPPLEAKLLNWGGKSEIG